jgi:hypothetical protein
VIGRDAAAASSTVTTAFSATQPARVRRLRDAGQSRRESFTDHHTVTEHAMSQIAPAVERKVNRSRAMDPLINQMKATFNRQETFRSIRIDAFRTTRLKR